MKIRVLWANWDGEERAMEVSSSEDADQLEELIRRLQMRPIGRDEFWPSPESELGVLGHSVRYETIRLVEPD